MPTDPRIQVRVTDPSHPGIVPRSVPPQNARLTTLSLVIRTMADYDMNFLQDRLVSDLWINGKPTGIHAVTRLPDEVVRGSDASDAIRFFGDDLEQALIEEFVGTQYRQKVQVLEGIVRDLQDFVERDRWWQFMPVRRWTRNFWLRLRNA